MNQPATKKMKISENLSLNNGKLVFNDKEGRSLKSGAAIRKIVNRIYNWWLDFQIMIADLSGYCVLWWWRKFIYRLFGLKIGSGSKIHYGARFFRLDNVEIGDDTKIGEFAFLDGRASLKIGSHTDIASQVLIYNSEHDIHSESMVAIEAAVEIGDYVFIGPRAIILPGVKINKGAVVAAGAVVTKDVAAGKIVAGIPAVEIGNRGIKEYRYKLGRSRIFQ